MVEFQHPHHRPKYQFDSEIQRKKKFVGEIDVPVSTIGDRDAALVWKEQLDGSRDLLPPGKGGSRVSSRLRGIGRGRG